jgi:hypothetical protein
MDAGGGHAARQTSSSAKADDPVFRAAQDFTHAGDYWMPAFAGMTVAFRG